MGPKRPARHTGNRLALLWFYHTPSTIFILQTRPSDMSESVLAKLRAWSPTFSRRLELYPDELTWLQANLGGGAYRHDDLEREWQACCGEEPAACTPEALACLQRFRRRISMRVACREIGNLAPVTDALEEMSQLAGFCLGRLCDWIYRDLEARFGTPNNVETGKTCTYAVMALGKLGGGELNFCSDIDLVYLFDGPGHCWKGGRETRMNSEEFFNRFFRELSAKLTETQSDGPLYNLDLRLRPEGESGPIVRTYNATVNYYWSAGQLWERMAWLKARVVAGSRLLAGELLEELNPFRYPRFPTENLLAEIAGLKVRHEMENYTAESLAGDIKIGPGGIREVEFIIQSLQLLHGGRNPFLQTGSTLEAIEQLRLYELLGNEDAKRLREAYLFLRLVENRLQIREDNRCHILPGDKPTQCLMAESLDYASWQDFQIALDDQRNYVRQRYEATFHESPNERRIRQWSDFLGGKAPEPEVRRQLQAWFPIAEGSQERVRHFVLGRARHLVTREQVTDFLNLEPQMTAILPEVARPLRTVERLADFAAVYGTPRQFIKSLENPGLFKALAFLFDRSTFIFRLLCQYPGMMEELMQEAPRRQKSRAELKAEVGLLPRGKGFSRLLWLYVKAEQVRLAMGELLFELPLEQTSQSLTNLADVAVEAALGEIDPAGHLAVVAAGKFGSGELTPGSDLDLIVLAPREHYETCMGKAKDFARLLQFNRPLGPLFQVDQRLRPHGRNGPLVVTPEAFREYHEGVSAQMWERQLLGRCRHAAGNPALGQAFESLRLALLFQQKHHLLTADMIAMRQKIEDATPASKDDFKKGPGGLLDIEFIAQWLQLNHGAVHEELRCTSTIKILRTAGTIGCLDSELASELLSHYHFLRMLELSLRRVDFTPETCLPNEPLQQRSLALWLGFEDYSGLRADLQRRMARVRNVFRQVLPPAAT